MNDGLPNAENLLSSLCVTLLCEKLVTVLVYVLSINFFNLVISFIISFVASSQKDPKVRAEATC